MGLPFLAEEVLHQLAAVGGEDAADDGGFGVQGAGGILAVAALGVVAAVNDAGHLGPAQGSGAHGARFDGDVEGAVGKVLAAEGVGSGGDGLHLGVGGDVVERLRQVVGTGHDALMADDDAADGDFALVEGPAGLVQGKAHVFFVFFFHFFEVSNFRYFEVSMIRGFDDSRFRGYLMFSVPLQLGKALQLQNSLPELTPFWATRLIMGFPHNGHTGALVWTLCC